MERLLQWSTGIFKKPVPVLLVFFVITVILAMGIPLLKSDNDIKSMLPANDRARLMSDLYDSEENFGSSNAVFVGIESPDVYSLETLTYIKTVKDKIEALSRSLPAQGYSRLLHLTPDEGATILDALRTVGINDINYQDTLVKLVRSSEELQKRFSWDKSFADKVATAAKKVSAKKLFAFYDTPLGKIQSLVNADYIAFEDDALVSKKLIDNEELTPENIDGLRRRVQSWNTYEGVLVSKDEKLTSIVVVLKTDDIDVKSAFNSELHGILATPPANYHVFVAGEPIVIDQLSLALVHDIPIMLPLVFLVIALLLFYCFRSIIGIAYPLLVTTFSVVWALGLMGYLGIPLTVVGACIPVLLMAIVSAYSIHQVNHFYEDPLTDKLAVLTHNAKSVGLAIFLSGITVMVGFGSLITQSFIPIRNFGVFIAWGDLVGIVGALFVLPALLLLGASDKKAGIYRSEDQKTDFIAGLLHSLVRLNRRHSKAVLAVFSILGVTLLAGCFLVKSELDFVKFFRADDPVQIADNVMNEKMAGTKTLSIILDSDLRDPIARKGAPDRLIDLATPEVLKKVDQFATDVRKAFPAVQKTSSFSDVMKKMNQEMNSGDPAFYAIPDDPALISQYLIIFSGDTKTYLTNNHDKLRITLLMNAGSSDDIHKVALYSQAYFDPDFRNRNHLQIQVTGAQQLAYEANQKLLKGTTEGIVLCVIVVSVILLLTLRSFPMTLIGITPVLFCLLVDFGFLGFSGITLNTATALVSSISIGIGVDFSIHFITWYRRELRVDGDIIRAIERSIVNKGRAILYNLFVIAAGFLVLLASRIVPLNQFGLLTAICMTFTAAGALLIVPAILRLLSAKQLAFLYLGVKETQSRNDSLETAVS